MNSDLHETLGCLNSKEDAKVLAFPGSRDLACTAELENEIKRLEATIASIGDGITIQDLNFRIIYQNKAMRELVGDHTGQLCYQAYENRDQVCPGCLVDATFRDGNIHSAERRVITIGGKRVPVEITASPLKDASGRTIAAIEVMRDITRRKKAEQELRENQQRLEQQLCYSGALNCLAETIASSDSTHLILENAARIVGTTLKADSSLIFDVNSADRQIRGFGKWVNIGGSRGNRAASEDVYCLDDFRSCHEYFLEYRRYLQSHEEEVNFRLLECRADELLHRNLGIRSLLWVPFAFRDQDYHVLVLNQLSHRRDWNLAELEFIHAVAKLVEIAVQKIRFLEERHQSEEAVWEEKERAFVTMHSVGDAVITTSACGKIEYMNPVAADLTGWSIQEAKGLPVGVVFQVVNEDLNSIDENPVERCLRQREIIRLYNPHVSLYHRGGYRIPIDSLAAVPVKSKDHDVTGAILVFHDETEKRNLLQQMLHQAHHDPLTDLPNRTLFRDRLNLALLHARLEKRLLPVMLLDIDRFKNINDMLGHAMGDKLLKKVAEEIMKCLDENCTLSRLGGDEFALLLPGLTNKHEVQVNAGTILEAVQRPVILDRHEFTVTASLGIAIFPWDGEDAETLLKHADIAMYKAKEQGGNSCRVFDHSMNRMMMERHNMERSLRMALERNEFTVFYQPKVNVKTETISGVEALVRWQHPEKGLLLPGDFIPVAEQTKLIIPLGEHVLRTACLQNRAWQERGFLPLKVSVNLSPLQFQQPDLAETVKRVLRETGMEPCLLELEITESAAMQDAGFSINVLRNLRQMGVRIALDDFGTGYSSLNYLKQLPLDTLKIDRSFMRDVTANEADAAIVTTIMVLARNLKLDLVAEGIETQEQVEFLRKRQCFTMQGFLFGNPVSAEEMEEKLVRISPARPHLKV